MDCTLGLRKLIVGGTKAVCVVLEANKGGQWHQSNAQ